MKTWADLSADDEQKIRAYLDSHPAGKRLVEWIAGAGNELAEKDRDFALWSIALDQRCAQVVDGMSFMDLSDFLWRDAFDNDMSPSEALTAALGAEGL